MFGLSTAYFLGAAAGWVIAGAVAVFVFGDVDPKFRQAPFAAFQVELIVGTVFTLLSTVVVGAATTLLRDRLSTDRRSVLVSVAWGLAYPLLWRFGVSQILGTFDAESLAGSAVGWAYLVIFPLLMFFSLTKLGKRGANPHGEGAI